VPGRPLQFVHRRHCVPFPCCCQPPTAAERLLVSHNWLFRRPGLLAVLDHRSKPLMAFSSAASAHPRLRRSRWSSRQRQPGERTCMHPASLVGSCSCALWLHDGCTYLRQRRMWLHTMATGRSRPPGPLHGHFCSPCHHPPRWRRRGTPEATLFPEEPLRLWATPTTVD
jgi:hypothetical protein